MFAPTTLGRYTLAVPTDRPLALAWPTLAPGDLVVIERAARGPAIDPPRAERLAQAALEQIPLAPAGFLPLRDAFVWRSGLSVEVCFVHAYSPGFLLSALLAQARRRGEPVPPTIATALARGMLRALHALHTGDDGRLPVAVHGHLTADRVIVGEEILLGGLTDQLRAWPPAWRQQATTSGLRLLAPEQARSEPLSSRTDLHRAATLLWETLTGHPRLNAPDHLGLLAAIAYGTPVPPSRHRPDLPPDLDRALLRALARRPQDRHPSALALLDELTVAAPPASPPQLLAWASTLGAEPFPGPEVYQLPARDSDDSPPSSSPAPLRSPYR